MASAGRQLRERLDAMLAARGAGWKWSPFDEEVIASAVRHADRAQQLQKLYDQQLTSGAPSAAALTRLGAEIRHQERRVIELTAMLTVASERPKSRQQQAAANARWDRKRDRDGTVVPMRGAQ